MIRKIIMAILVAILLILLTYSSVKPITETPIAYASEIVDATTTIKTLNSEVNRLSIKYEVSSSTALAIIKCESAMLPHAVHHNLDSTGKEWSFDFSFFQINSYYHLDTMSKLGLNFYDEWDSLEYGFILLKKNGLNDWTASKWCWNKIK